MQMLGVDADVMDKTSNFFHFRGQWVWPPHKMIIMDFLLYPTCNYLVGT